MGDIDLNAQGDINMGGDVVGRDKITTTNITYEATAPLALNLHQLLSPPRDFTGRTAELEELMAAVEKGGVTISGLHGLGGIGKTALALKLAAQLAERYPDAQFYLDLKGVSEKPLTPAEALVHVVRAYYPEQKLPDDETQLRGLYRSVLHGKHALLLLDNARDAAQVAPLLPPPGCIAIVTSRQHFALSGLRSVNLDELPPGDAKDLIRRIVTRLSAEQMANALDEMARLCGYLPLALRASASALQERIDLSPADYVRRLRDENKRLQLEGLKAEGVPISVAASFNLSYQLLMEEQQKLWRALAVFPDSFDRAAAAAVWGFEPDPAQDALSELVKYSLLDYLPSPAGGGAGGEGELPGRYRLHDLARLFALSRLTEAERDIAQQRHAAHYADVFRRANQLLLQGGDAIKIGLALYDLEQPNITAGQNWAQQHTGQNEAAAKACNWYAWQGSLLNLRFHPRDQIRWMEAALAAARQLKNRKAEGAHLGNLGLAYAALGDARKAIEFYEQDLAIAREIGDRLGEGTTLGNLGLAHYSLGDARKAIEFYEQHLAIAREIGDRLGEGAALGSLGLAHAAFGDARKAIEFYEQHLAIAREIGDRQGEGAALGNLGNAYKNLGDARKAIEFYEQQLIIVRDIGDRRSEGAALGNLGNAYADLGDARKAIEFYEQHLAIAREIGDRQGEGSALWNMSLALDSLGDRAQAIGHAEAALKIYEQIESPYAERVRKQLAEWRGEGV
jgi:tetratricopeptide (TPR) repeat protein